MSSTASKVAKGTAISAVAGMLAQTDAGRAFIGQVVGAVADVANQIPGGDHLVGEIIDEFPDPLKAAVRPLVYPHLYDSEKGDEEVPDPKKKPGEGQQQGGGSKVDKAVGIIAQLNPTSAARVRKWLVTAGELKDAILERIGAGFNQKSLQTVSEQYGDDATIEDLKLIFGVTEPEKSEAGKKKAHEKGAAVLDWQKADVRTALLRVLGSRENDKDPDTLRFYQTLSYHYGDGGEDAKQAAQNFCESLVELSFDEQRNALGVRSNVLQRVFGGVKSAPVSDETVKAAFVRADAVWDRVRQARKDRAARRLETTHQAALAIVPQPGVTA